MSSISAHAITMNVRSVHRLLLMHAVILLADICFYLFLNLKLRVFWRQ